MAAGYRRVAVGKVVSARADCAGRRRARTLARAAALSIACFTGCVAGRSREDPLHHDEIVQRRELSRAAESAAGRGDWAQAQVLLDRLAVVAPAAPEAHVQRGWALAEQGRNADAEAAYRRALELDAQYPAALVGLGKIETRSGRLQEALGHLDAAIELDPRRGEAHLARAQTLEAFGRGEEALAAYFRAIEFDPSNNEALIGVARLQIDAGHPEQALARIERSLEIDGKRAETWHQRGRARLALGDAAGAIGDLRLAAQGSQPDSRVFYDLALAYERVNLVQDARAAAEQAVRLAPQHVAAGQLLERLRR